jgi:hypothetical protein
MALQRPLKEGSVRTYQEKVGLGFTDILASEADADFDTIYAAWNGTLGGDLTGTLPNPIVAAAAKSKWAVSGSTLTPVDATKTVAVTGTVAGGVCYLQGSTTVKQRLRDVGASGLQICANTAGAATPDDATKPSWYLSLDPSSDVIDIYRAPAAASQTFALMSRFAADGSLATTGNLTVGSAGSPRVNVGLRAAVESWDGGIVSLYANDPGTTGYTSTLASWKVQFDYRASGPAASVSYRPASGAYGPTWTFDTLGNWVISGTIGQKATGTTWSNPSDIRLKKDVAPYAHGLADILQLEPISYTLKATDQQTCGLDAEQVRAVFPECVGTTRMKLQPEDEEETEVLTLDIHPILIALINAVKELAARVSPVPQPT